MACLTSSTLTRRLLVRLFPGRPPRRGVKAALASMRVISRFADWLQVRSETVAMELEDLLASRKGS